MGKTTQTKYREKLSRSCNSLLHGMESFAKAHTRFVTCKTIKLLMFTYCTKKKAQNTLLVNRATSNYLHSEVQKTLQASYGFSSCKRGPASSAKMLKSLSSRTWGSTSRLICQNDSKSHSCRCLPSPQLTTLAFTNHGFSSNVQLYSKEVLLRDSRVTQMRFKNHDN